MALSSRIKLGCNNLLQGVNLKLETLTKERQEQSRLAKLRGKGYYHRPAFTLPKALETMDITPVMSAVSSFQSRFDTFQRTSDNDIGYSFNNTYFSSPDAEVLYAMMHLLNPQTVVEVGSGNSTKIMRQAVTDGSLQTEIVSIDPYPRVEIEGVADNVLRVPVQDIDDQTLFSRLQSGDIFFIDSSHEIVSGNDVIDLYFNRIPALKEGVVIHIHDIFLPYDYPADWVSRIHPECNEQYLVQALLQYGDCFDVLWAGHYLQRTRPDVMRLFPHERDVAGSLWLRKRRNSCIPGNEKRDTLLK